MSEDEYHADETDQDEPTLETPPDVTAALDVVRECLDLVERSIPRLTHAGVYRESAAGHAQAAARYLSLPSVQIGLAASHVAWGMACVDCAAPGRRKMKLAAALRKRWEQVREALPESIRGQMVERSWVRKSA